MIDWAGGSTARKGAAQPSAVNAPLLKSVFDGLETAGRCVVMDLGAANTQTIAMLSRFPCRLDIADLPDSLAPLNAPDLDDASLQQAVEALLPGRHAEPVDLVLCWDILNYLNKAALKALMANVAGRARPGASLHALIYYSGTHMPEAPGVLVPLPDCSLASNDAGPATRQAPRYTPDDLTRAMPGYRIERAMLLSNGMQEFLFTL